MIKVPATEAGIPAIEELTARGVNVNVTLLFSVARYEQVIDAYLARPRATRGRRASRVDAIASVASFFVSRVDAKADALLPADSDLRGRVAIANAHRAYGRYRERFADERWRALRDAGARPQRPLWASTGTKDPAYSDVLYVEELIAPDVINTMPEATLRAFADHGEADARARARAPRAAEEILRQARATRASTSPRSPRSSSAKACSPSAPPTTSCSTASRPRPKAASWRPNVPTPSDDDFRGLTANPRTVARHARTTRQSKEPTMAITTPQSRFKHAASANGGDAVPVRADWRDPRYQAFSLLRLAFTVAPIAFGLDKFFNVLVDWPTYLAPWINDIAPGSGQDFMYVVGAIEIVAGHHRRAQAPLRRLRRRRLAGRHRHQPAHLLRLLRHRPARLRAHARRAHPRPTRVRLRPPAAARPPLSDRCERTGEALTTGLPWAWATWVHPGPGAGSGDPAPGGAVSRASALCGS